MVRVGLEIKLFEVLATSESPLTTNWLAEKTEVEPALMGEDIFVDDAGH